jgi:hypothetical protein
LNYPLLFVVGRIKRDLNCHNNNNIRKRKIIKAIESLNTIKSRRSMSNYVFIIWERMCSMLFGGGGKKKRRRKMKAKIMFFDGK